MAGEMLGDEKIIVEGKNAVEHTFMAVDDDKLYDALCRRKDSDVIKICNEAAEGPLHYCTMHHSTVLHLACYFKNWDLANNLFDSLSENQRNILSERRNECGDTVLHDVATSNSDKAVKLAEKMLRISPELLPIRNKAGETCVFRATRYGKMKMFEFLAKEVHTFCESSDEVDLLHFFKRQDDTTILHMAILTRYYGMALMIAKEYPELHHLKVRSKWTALQFLACSPTAFESGARFVPFGLLRKYLYKCVSIDEEGDRDQVGLIKNPHKLKAKICEFCRIFPIIEEVSKMKKSHKDALELSKILIESDTSWRETYKPSAEGSPEIISNFSDDNLIEEDMTSSMEYIEKGDEHKEEGTTSKSPRESSWTEDKKKNGSDGDATRKEFIKLLNETLKKRPHEEYESEILDSGEAPLLMAARKGCIEIVEETLERYPQAVYYVNRNQENLLHVAIRARNMKIFDYVDNNVTFIRGLLRAFDTKNNSILHMVGYPRVERLDKKMKSPVLQLSEDLRLLERLKERCPSYLQYHRNNKMRTADELFAKRNEDLRKEAKEWLRKTAEHSTVVIILIATVAFAAAYTVPGGPDEKTGYPKLLTKPLFIVFTVTDVLSLGFALTAVVVFLSIITSSYQLNTFRRSLPCRLFLGFSLLFLSVTMMMVAFAATIILMVDKKMQWTKIALYVVAFFPICIFMLSYVPVYTNLAKDATMDWFKEFRKFLPHLHKKHNALPCYKRPESSHSSFKSV